MTRKESQKHREWRESSLRGLSKERVCPPRVRSELGALLRRAQMRTPSDVVPQLFASRYDLEQQIAVQVPAHAHW